MPRFSIVSHKGKLFVKDNDRKEIFSSLRQVVEVMNSIETQRSMAQWNYDRTQNVRSGPIPTKGHDDDSQ